MTIAVTPRSKNACTPLLVDLTYAIQQETLPIFVSEMVSRAEGFHGATFARRIDGAWELRGLGAFALTSHRPSLPHLLSANAPVVSWSRDRSRVRVSDCVDTGLSE